MNKEYFRSAYNKIMQMTFEGALQWEFDGEDSFTVSFTRATLDLRRNLDHDPPSYQMDLRNDDGVLIAYFSRTECDSPAYGGVGVIFVDEDVEDLFQTVLDRVYNYEEVLDSLSAELDKIQTKWVDDHTKP